jgi:hypothetical protein
MILQNEEVDGLEKGYIGQLRLSDLQTMQGRLSDQYI